VLRLRHLILVAACLSCSQEPPASEPRLVAAGVDGLVVLLAPPGSEGTISVLARTREGRLLALVARDLADPVVADLGARRELAFRFEPDQLVGAGESFVLEARHDPDGVPSTNEPGSASQRRLVAPGARQLRFELESQPLAAER
jgi:hypothetical protein